MPRMNRVISSPGFIADHTSIVRRGGGVQIDWTNVSTTNADGKKYLPAGKAMGTLLGNGLASPRVVTTNPAVGLLETDAVQGDPDAALSGYGLIIGGAFYENLLPDATGGPPAALPAAIVTELRAVGTGYAFQTYADSRV